MITAYRMDSGCDIGRQDGSMTYREAAAYATEMLGSAGIEYAENESRLLMEYVTQADLGFYLMHADEDMPEEKETLFFDLAETRCGRVPLQHLTGVQEFMGIPIKVSEDVLIPRQDTEILAEEAVRAAGKAFEAHGIKTAECAAPDSASGGSGGYRVLDLCTGSGCIALAIKSACPDALVYGSDISGAALCIAAENAAVNGLDVEWIESDLFSDIEGQFDLIVSNPPYIPTDVLDTLMPEVRDHEPRMALDGGPDGLDFYRKILAGCGTRLRPGGYPSLRPGENPRLRPGGYLLLEIGADQADAVTSLMEENGFLEIRVIRDLAGLERVVSGRQGVPETQESDEQESDVKVSDVK